MLNLRSQWPAYSKYLSQRDIQSLDDMLILTAGRFLFMMLSSRLLANGQLERTDATIFFFNSKDNLKLSFPPILTNEAVLSVSKQQIATKTK